LHFLVIHVEDQFDRMRADFDELAVIGATRKAASTAWRFPLKT
jgi:hypothetical protein